MKKIVRISEKHKDVTCKNCGWSWDIEPDDKHPYLCHQCGHENTKGETDEGAGAYDAPSFQMEPDHVHFKHQYNEQNIKSKYLLQMERKSVILEQSRDEIELFKLASSYYKKNGKENALKVLEHIIKVLSKRDMPHRPESQEFPPSLNLQEQKGPNEKVRKIQSKLISLGYNLGKTGADGFWGGLTDKAWKQYKLKKKQNSNTEGGNVNKLTPNKNVVGFLDCVNKSPKKKISKTPNGVNIITIDNYVFFDNRRVRTPEKKIGSYFCYGNGVKIKTDDGNKTFLETGVQTKYEETSRFSGGILGFLRKSFPNVAEILSTKPLTGSDFTESQKSVINNVIQNSIRRGNNAKQGCTEYIDYSPETAQKLKKDGGATTSEMLLGSGFSDEFRIATTLGRFCYKMNSDGSYLVTDDYDFSKWKNFTVKSEELKNLTYPQKIGYIMDKTDLSPYGAIRHIGYLEHPDNAPASTKTKINVIVQPSMFAKNNKNPNSDDTRVA